MAAALLLGAAACTERIQLGADATPPELPGLVSLRVTPALTTLAVDDSGPVAVAFVATGTFVAGDQRDVTAQVTWTAENRAPGDFVAPGQYQTSGRAGGRVVVRARSGSISGTAEVAVVLTLAVQDSLFPPPPGAASLFDRSTPIVFGDAARAPAVRYPANDTMFPPDLARMLFQYDAGTANDVWRLAFDSTHLHLVVLTGATRWQPDGELWATIVESNTGGSLVLSVIAGTAGDATAVYAAAPVDLHVAAQPAGGAIYYWTEAGSALMRGGPSDSAATRTYAVPPDTTCVGCHAVSRDGRKIALGYGGEELRVIDFPGRNVLVGATGSQPMGWATFSPDGTQAVVADKGKLAVIDVTTGESLGDVPLGTGKLATHPDWSPDGQWLVVALGRSVGNRDLKGGSIARIPWTDGAWGEPEELVPSSGDNDNNYFPRWSPDGSVIAYVHADEPARGALTAELRLIAADGEVAVVPALANRRVAAEDVGDLANTMPSWAPSGVPGTYWLAFASRRDYGSVLAGGDLSQIWAAAIDVTALGTGVDPSHAAFWAPFQDPTTMNHVPCWAVLPTLE